MAFSPLWEKVPEGRMKGEARVERVTAPQNKAPPNGAAAGRNISDNS
jgi:hypothetical protein